MAPFKSPEPEIPFFTKDIFRGRKFDIGDFTYGNPTVLFENEQAQLTIGKFCSIADNVTLFLGGNHRSDWISTYPFSALAAHFPDSAHIKGHPATNGSLTIGNDVWIGRNVTILSGITIGDGAVLAAGSVVTKNVGDYEIWGGNPAKLIRKRFSEQQILELKQISWWDWDIEKIKENTPILCSENMGILKSIQ